MTKRIRRGSIVRLNSGGPVMTVKTVYWEDDVQTALCTWGTSQATFPIACLTILS